MRALVGFVVVVLSFLFVSFVDAKDAQAQIIYGPTYGQPEVEDSPRSGYRRLAPNSYRLFDTFTTERSIQLSLGPIWSRQVQDETPAQRLQGFERGAPLAGELSIGMTFTTPYKPFFLHGRQRTLLRILDDKSFSWSLFHQDLSAGVMIGPFYPDIGIGASILSVDIFHAEPSLQFFSPRVSAGLGIKIGKIRLDARMHAEYLWRWWGPDYLVRGVTLGVGFDMAPFKSPLEEQEKH